MVWQLRVAAPPGAPLRGQVGSPMAPTAPALNWMGRHAREGNRRRHYRGRHRTANGDVRGALTITHHEPSSECGGSH